MIKFHANIDEKCSNCKEFFVVSCPVRGTIEACRLIEGSGIFGIPENDGKILCPKEKKK